MTSNHIDLTGHIALVTGASSGLGLRFAQVLAEAGATVVCAGRRIERVEAVAKDINTRGGKAIAIPLDVRDDAALSAAFDRIEAEVGTVDILVNNAGIPDAQFATKMSTELVDAVLGTNLRAPWLISCEFARRLIKLKQPGRIVNISSMAGFVTNGGGASLYAVTKTAMNRMTEALASEWAPFNINVNCIAPGAFASEMMDGMLERMGDITQGFPRKRLGQPNQMDSTLLYLVAPQSEFVTGTVVKVDDGQSSR
jgi:NAD(P)-dependent dehydrogenase (short-subunit alcohol dehydrogenase family)